MNASKTASFIGFALLIAAFLWSALRVVRPGGHAGDDDRKIIRFAHWQLESGLREAFDHLAREYETLHPGVRIEQVPVPERVFAQWMTTQLVGETITDLVALNPNKIGGDEALARHFIPLTDFVEQPNPYNVGSELEGVPLRETIVDGLQGTSSYRENLLEYYGVSLSMFTVRLYYNRSLWRRLLGDTPPPADYEELLRVCERIESMDTEKVIPVAGSSYNAPPIIDQLFASQTQRLQQRLDFGRTMRPSPQDISLAYLRGLWTLDDPAIVGGMDIAREMGRHFQPGFSQLGRDDAALYFVQGRALMIATGSWDSTSLRSQAPFEIGVIDIPIPSPDHPRYGANVLGVSTESETGTGLVFGLPRAGRHHEQALDFLRFLASRRANAEFSRLSGWLPSVVGVRPPPEIEPFLPRERGYVNGFTLRFGADSSRIVSAGQFLWFSPNGSVPAFREKIRADYAASVRSDLDRGQRNAVANVARQDIILEGLHAADMADLKISRLIEAQNRREAQHAWFTLQLRLTADGEATPTPPGVP